MAWQHTIVPEKLYRALGCRTDQDMELALGGKKSAAVAMKSLTICILAFDHLGSRYAGLGDDCRRPAEREEKSGKSSKPGSNSGVPRRKRGDPRVPGSSPLAKWAQYSIIGP